MMSEKSVEIPLLVTRHYPDLDSPSDWLKQICHVEGPIKALPRSWQWYVISMAISV